MIPATRAAPTATGLSLGRRIMIQSFFVLAILASACGAQLPDGVVPLANGEQAAKAVLAFWQQDRAAPQVLGVLADPTCAFTDANGIAKVAFRHPDGGHCVGGYTDFELGAVFLVVAPNITYAAALPHELGHWVYQDSDHRKRGLWGSEVGGESDTNLVPRAAAWLRGQPKRDTMEVLR